MFQNSTILAFEARLDNYQKMLENFEKYRLSRFLAWNVAVSDSNGQADFHVSSGQAPKVTTWDTGNKSSSLLAPKQHLDIHKWCKFDTKITVDTRKLDCLMCETNLPGIDFVHLDVQGAEKMVLDGAVRALRDVKAIWCEVSTVEMYAGQPKKDEIVQYLNARGFRLVSDTCGNSSSGDCLFIRN
jgi:FkbM family methyltransferase